jgi:RNA polymerase sigma factor (sigma-70 family)
MNDSDLLIQFTHGSEKAFAELVRRHVDLAFDAALRHVAGDRHRAEDIVQQVFIDLARKARTLTSHPTLTGWLYSSTRYTALNTLRSDQRRAMREKQSDVMNTITTGTEPRWEQIRPVIDEALHELDEDDRQSVLLRFFGQQPFAAIAAQLGISENAAQKRVDRALERLNVVFKRRGISSTAVALGLALGESCVAAPATLAGTVTTAALVKVAGLGAGTFALASGFKIAAAAAVVGIIGWAGVKWSWPAVVEQKQAPSPRATDARPARTEMKSNPVVIDETPKVIESIPSKPVEKLPPTPTPLRKMYVVQAGDTLKRIASAAGVTPEALHAENPGYDFTRMRVGNQMQLPANATLPSALREEEPQAARTARPIPTDQLYIVQRGDTLLTIAQKRDLLLDELKALNPETNWQQLRVGQQIRAP